MMDNMLSRQQREHVSKYPHYIEIPLGGLEKGRVKGQGFLTDRQTDRVA